MQGERMSIASKAFAENRREQLFRKAPVQDNVEPTHSKPWLQIRNGEMPPVMFQLRFQNGEVISYAYSDLREIRFRDAGYVQLGIIGMTRMLITIEGRHLRELAEAMGSGLIRWIEESDERDFGRPETSPAITEITIEQVQGS